MSYSRQGQKALVGGIQDTISDPRFEMTPQQMKVTGSHKTEYFI